MVKQTLRLFYLCFDQDVMECLEIWNKVMLKQT